MSLGQAIFWITAIKNAREDAKASAENQNSDPGSQTGKPVKSLKELHAKLTQEKNRKKGP